ncbi:cytochrome C oxidase subunit II [Gracilibacillus thailandensis]|uniref:Cytochrome C oxidase subunit II n=1 Tax=Gracilibacillus thailandensis TaxID=563735 RepID=A0A6N7QWC8_9BACI|nr:cytochrome C oxidase subunit II [Gracilibacillus thailandensis]MRI66417.1 cytochrome C oxidase subunit II [Gracilibacillus thailandensis]
MKKILLTMMTLSLALVLAACGSGDDEGSSNNNEEAASGDGETVDIQASNWQFDQEEYTVPAGEVTVNLTNEEGFHGIEIEGTDIALDDAGSQTATLEPGEYTIRCSIQCGPGHDDMVATLIVE